MRFSDAVFRPHFSLVDTHCHYNLEPLFESWQSHLSSAINAKVNFTWIPGTNLETSRRAIDLSQKEETFFAFTGIHPTEVMESEFDLEISMSQLRRMRDSAAETDKPIAGIGEIGLDYYRIADENQLERQEQRQWFRRQLHLAKEWELPVILHVRDSETPESPEVGNAYWDTLQIVKEVGIETDFTLHCVSGPINYVKEMLSLGAYCGFDGNISYPNAHAIREIWRLVPADHRLIETDAPYLPPQEFRGQICEPWMIRETAAYCAEL